MTILLKVCLRNLPIRRVFWTERMPFDTNDGALVVANLPITGVLRRRLRPRYQLVPVSAHQLLILSDMHTRHRGHGGIVCTALDVLSQRIETMVVVIPLDVGMFASY